MFCPFMVTFGPSSWRFDKTLQEGAFEVLRLDSEIYTAFKPDHREAPGKKIVPCQISFNRNRSQVGFLTGAFTINNKSNP